MIQLYIKYFIIFITAVLLQVLVFDHIRLGGYLNPYFYVIFILLLPFETPRWILLTSAFMLGLTVDIFSNTIGMHAFASVFMAFLRPVILRTFSPREGYDAGTLPRLYYYGFNWFIKYSLSLILAHHLILFTIEVFGFSGFIHTFIRIIASTLLTTLIVLISQFFIYRK